MPWAPAKWLTPPLMPGRRAPRDASSGRRRFRELICRAEKRRQLAERLPERRMQIARSSSRKWSWRNPTAMLPPMPIADSSVVTARPGRPSHRTAAPSGRIASISAIGTEMLDLQLSPRSAPGGPTQISVKQRASLGLKSGQKRAQSFHARRSQLLRVAGVQLKRQLVDGALQDGHH
jgi:hypothetical protein